MMETKLWVALCALLLANLGSADRDGSEATPKSPAAESKPTSSLNPIMRAVTPPSPNVTNASAEVTSSLGSNTTTVAPEPKKENGTSTGSPSEATSPEKNQTHQSTAQPPIPASESHAPTSHIPLSSTTISSTPLTNISHNATFPPPDSNSTSNKPTHNQTFTPGSTPEPPKPDNTTHNTSVQSSTTSSSSSSQEPHSTESHTLTALQTTVQPDRHSETSTAARQKSTTSSLNSSTTQAKAHTETPSQLNVGGDTMMNHEAPTLDPLLAGLVSAFIVTAVIIALLLFLKLRRRDNRPEFRRLQELPMDDMMEDTPLSMYSY